MFVTSHGAQIRGEVLPAWLEWLPKNPFHAMACHSMDFWLSSEDLPRPENRIYYDGDRVVLDLTEGNMEAHGGTAHQAGTARFGSMPRPRYSM